MNTITIWILALTGLGLFVYFVPYKNIKNVQKLQKESLEKLDTIIELLPDSVITITASTFKCSGRNSH